MQQYALFDPSTGHFLSRYGGHTLKLGDIRLYEGLGEAERVRRIDERLQIVPCEGDWCAKYAVSI